MIYGKVGQSLSRCVKDIVEGRVDINDVLCVITRTSIPTRDAIEAVIQDYEYRDGATSLYGLGHEECMRVAYDLWDRGLLHQPRLTNPTFGNLIADEAWLDLVPTPKLTNPMVVEAYQHYEMLRRLAE
jgi:hypothetical protein